MSSPSKDLPVIRAVGGVVYRFDERGRLSLLLIRKCGGFWTLPKGKIEQGEGELDALAREVVEETGLSGRIGAPVREVSYKIIKRGQPFRKQVTYYLICAEAGVIRLNPDEQIVKANWFTPNAAMRRLHRGRLRVVLRHAFELIPIAGAG